MWNRVEIYRRNKKLQQEQQHEHNAKEGWIIDKMNVWCFLVYGIAIECDDIETYISIHIQHELKSTIYFMVWFKSMAWLQFMDDVCFWWLCVYTRVHYYVQWSLWIHFFLLEYVWVFVKHKYVLLFNVYVVIVCV